METMAPNRNQQKTRGLGGCHCSARQRTTRSRSCCLHVSQDIQKPDLATYSQDEQLALSNIPTWNSPDILTNTVLPFALLPEAHITVRNLSSVPASNALVHIMTSPYGIGTQKTPVLSQKLNFAGGQTIELLYPLSQAILTGDKRIGIHIVIEHPYDTQTVNNQGAQVIDIKHTSLDGRAMVLPIPVLNNSAFSQPIQLHVLPTDILATITPAVRTFAPFEQIIADLAITVPSFLTGSAAAAINREVTVIGRLSDGTVIGGITLLLNIDN